MVLAALDAGLRIKLLRLILFLIKWERSSVQALTTTELLVAVNETGAGKTPTALDAVLGAILLPATEWLDVVQRGVVHAGVTLTEGLGFADSGMPYEATK